MWSDETRVVVFKNTQQLFERRCSIKHYTRGYNTERQTERTTSNNKRYRFKPQNKNNKTCENSDPMKLELSYILNYTQQRRRGHRDEERERESTLTSKHSCHSPRIPFGHILIELRCFIKHCKRECEQRNISNHKIKSTTRVRSLI